MGAREGVGRGDASPKEIRAYANVITNGFTRPSRTRLRSFRPTTR